MHQRSSRTLHTPSLSLVVNTEYCKPVYPFFIANEVGFNDETVCASWSVRSIVTMAGSQQRITLSKLVSTKTRSSCSLSLSQSEVHRLLTWGVLGGFVAHSVFSQNSHSYPLKRAARCNAVVFHRTQLTAVILVTLKAELHLVTAKEVVLSVVTCYTITSCCSYSSVDSKQFLEQRHVQEILSALLKEHQLKIYYLCNCNFGTCISENTILQYKSQTNPFY